MAESGLVWLIMQGRTSTKQGNKRLTETPVRCCKVSSKSEGGDVLKLV